MILDLLRRLLPSLRPLLLKRDTWYAVVICVLALVLWDTQAKLKSSELALAAKPKIEEHRQDQVKTDAQTKERREEGRVKIVKEYLPAAGKCDPVVVRETIEKEPVVTVVEKIVEVDRKTDSEHSVSPACPAYQAKRWHAGMEIGSEGPVGGRAGITLFDRIDLSAAYRKDGQDRLLGSVGFRF